jgi:hypothetical protein
LLEPSAITIVSGGQTGADRAALDFAIEQGLAHAGWCPRGRLAEDGPIPRHYDLIETPSRRYALRTGWNIRDTDATVVFSIGRQIRGGTRLTLSLARRAGKPALHLSREAFCGHAGGTELELGEAAHAAAAELIRFLAALEVRRLNIAGPRASQEPEIGQFVKDVLCRALMEP